MFLVQATGPLFFLAKQTGVTRQTLACQDRGSNLFFPFAVKNWLPLVDVKFVLADFPFLNVLIDAHYGQMAWCFDFFVPVAAER